MSGAHDHRQHVVEVVGDTPSELAEKLHLLRLVKLRFAFRSAISSARARLRSFQAAS